MKCKKCGSSQLVKNGNKNGNPYYKCKECGKQFSNSVVDISKLKSNAVVLYCVGLSFRTIGLLLGYTHVCILQWVRELAEQNYSKPIPKGNIIIELDEMWHFLHQKKTNCGFGRHIAAKLDNLLTGNPETEVPKLLKECIID